MFLSGECMTQNDISLCEGLAKLPEQREMTTMFSKFFLITFVSL